MNVRNTFRSLKTINVFESTSTDDAILHQERRFTRIYFITLIIGIIIVLLYTGLKERSTKEIVQAPTNVVDYQYLLARRLNNLRCSCTQISIPYRSFISAIDVTSFHPVCSSDFVSSAWISYFVQGDYGPPTWVPTNDIRIRGAANFRSLQKLCSMAQGSVQNSLLTFLSSTLLTDGLVSEVEFDRQMNGTLHHLQTTISARFSQTLELLRTTNQGNGLMSVFETNWPFVLGQNRSSMASLYNRPIHYNNSTCSCATSRSCFSPAAIMYANATPLFIVDGPVYGYTILESLLQSKLTCFYSFSCVDQLVDAMPLGGIYVEWKYKYYPNPFSRIDLASSSFTINDTIETIVDRMFIDSWTSNVSYELFFKACAPRQCTFTYNFGFDPIDMLTTFLSVFGVLSLILYFLVPRLVKAANKI